MLPKGNVSKHHARLLFRDGRFIVTDLKSTNGTYVNGRKISQATIVREGDKIYIGDFSVLRLETGQVAASVEGRRERGGRRVGAHAGGPAPSPVLREPGGSWGACRFLARYSDGDSAGDRPVDVGPRRRRPRSSTSRG